MNIEEAMSKIFEMNGNIYKELTEMLERENVDRKSITNILRSIESLNDKVRSLSDRLYNLEKQVKKLKKKKGCNELE